MVEKWASHFEIFGKINIQYFALHFHYNENGFKIIESHVQGTIRHCVDVNDLQYVAIQNYNGLIKVKTIEEYHSWKQNQHVNYNKRITSTQNPLSSQQKSMKEVKNRNHCVGMNKNVTMDYEFCNLKFNSRKN